MGALTLGTQDPRGDVQVTMDWVRKLEVLSLDRASACGDCLPRACRAAGIDGMIDDCRISEGCRIYAIIVGNWVDKTKGKCEERTTVPYHCLEPTPGYYTLTKRGLK